MEPNPNELKWFERWPVTVAHKFKLNEDTGEQERYLSRITKLGQAPLDKTKIEQRQADVLNAQAENSGFFYFIIE